MKLLILYTSETGSTKQYSEWLHEEFLESDLFDLNNFDFEKVKDYGLIIIGSPVRGGQFASLNIIKPNWDKIKDKKIFLMAVGAVPQEGKWSQKAYNMIPKEIRESFAGYMKLPGITAGEMNAFTKFIFRLFLGVKPEEMIVQKEVKREDLNRVVEWVREHSI